MKDSEQKDDVKKYSSQEDEFYAKAFGLYKEYMVKEMNEGIEDAEPHVFSAEFEANMEDLLKNPSQYTPEKRRRKSVISTVILVALLCLVLYISSQDSEAIFSPIGGMEEALIPDYIALRLDPDFQTSLELPQGISILYAPKQFPKGYNKEGEEITKSYYNIYYSNKRGADLAYNQFFSRMYINLDNEQSEYTKMVIENKKYHVLTRKHITRLVWDENGYQFSLEGDFTANQLIKIAQNLDIIKDGT